MHEVYRVLQPFHWRGWHYGPQHVKPSPVGGQFEPCDCEQYAGDIWIVEAGHPRKDAMLASRRVMGDASLPPAEELLKEERFRKLLSPPEEVETGKRRKSLAGSRGPM